MSIDDDIEKESAVTPWKETSELREVMDNLDIDTPDNTGMSKIDMNTRLTKSEIGGVLVVEELQQLGILPGVTINKKIKRLKVSQDGKGRGEKVAIVTGEREFRVGGSFMDKLKGLVTPR